MLPRSQGGKTSWENVVCSCVPCNLRKGGRTPEQAGMALLKKPVRPRWTPLFRGAARRVTYREWLPFLSAADASYWNTELVRGEDARAALGRPADGGGGGAMRIKQLEMTGFKSFMDRTRVHFDDGRHRHRRPERCGKSNVVDAIRWVHGRAERQAPARPGRWRTSSSTARESKPPARHGRGDAHLRAWTATRAGRPRPHAPPGSRASVTGHPPLFRRGESEYLINKTPCRLLDITELFLGTGVGTKAYSIIEQGRVGQIVSAQAGGRGTFIEEAAGTTQFHGAEGRRAEDGAHAREPAARAGRASASSSARWRSLERQAKRAEKYHRLKGELRELDLGA